MRIARKSFVFAVFALSAACVSCGSCGDQPATPVTFRVVNHLNWPIYVHDEDNQAGTRVQQNDGSSWQDLRETASCSCEECDSACSPCTCFGQSGIARRIDPGQFVERTWTGEFREASTATCGNGKVDCLGDRVAAQPGKLRVAFCYASSVGGGSATGDARFPAQLSDDALTCAFKEFDQPAIDTVEIETVQPPPCKTSAECPSNQICQQGQCSAGCLPSDVPALGGDWNVEIGGVDDRGFFTVTTDPKTGAKISVGQGKVSSVRYSAGTTNLTLIRYDANGLDFTATFYYSLPGKRAVPLTVGETLDVVLVQYPSGSRAQAAGLTIRAGGNLIVAADNGRGGPVLSPAQISPFTLKTDGDAFACAVADCGRRIHHRMEFDAGTSTANLEPGKAAMVTAAGSTWEAVAVGNYADEATSCGPEPVTPYAILRQREPAKQ